MILILCIIASFFLLATIHRVLEPFRPNIYDYPTKCFSCERDVINRLGPEWGWLGQNTKSFDAEKEMIRMSGGDIRSAFHAHPLKYY
jgi:hypothetical protein